MSLFRHFLGKGVFCAFLASTCFCLNACLEDDSSSGVAPSEKEQADSTKKQNDSKEQNSISISSEKCPEVTSKSQFLNPNIDYGEVVDKRDGHVYKTVKIGKQTWMAENLNYALENSLCVDSLDKNCEIYGRKYIDTTGVCPEGWHVPNMAEWSELLDAAGKKDGIDAAILKSRFGWGDRECGTDLLGFSVAPINCVTAKFLIGIYSGDEHSVKCVEIGLGGEYYRRDESYVTNCEIGYAYSSYRSITKGISVRCLKDEENEVPGPMVDIQSFAFWDNETKEDFFNPGVEYGEMTDERDGQTYRTVQIGEQTWMAENLNYVYKVDTLLEEEGVCSQISGKNGDNVEIVQTCDVFGRLYSYASAMDSAAVFSDDGKGCHITWCFPNKQIRGICPEGWRLPKDEDWNTLFETVGGVDIAGKKLKSSVGWNLGGNGTDDYGFSVTPSGTETKRLHYHTGFWSGGPDRFGVYFSFYKDAVYSGTSQLMHIRCVKGYTHVDSISRYIPGVDTSTVVHGTMTDERDGQTYKTVKIGEQTWMAENLNYNYQVSDTISIYGSVSRADIGDSGVDYGRFYTWPAAMDSAGIFSDDGKGCGFQGECKPTGRVRGVCPAGWHLPDSTEWNTLFAELNCVTDYGGNKCGPLLKSDHGWVGRSAGYDYYGFTVMPANTAEWTVTAYGMRFLSIQSNGSGAEFWTSMEYSDTQAIVVSFGLLENVSIYGPYKRDGVSIRCVKD